MMSLGQHEPNDGIDKQLLSCSRKSLWEGKTALIKQVLITPTYLFISFFFPCFYTVTFTMRDQMRSVVFHDRFILSEVLMEVGMEGLVGAGWRSERRDCCSPVSLHTYTHGSSQSGVLRRQSSLSRVFEMKDGWPFFKDILSP